MGKVKVYLSNDKITKRFSKQKSNTNCNHMTKNIVKTLRYMYQRIQKMSDFENTKDFQKYKLYPGQQIYSTGAFGMNYPIIDKIFTHHAIYFYDGIILEMGSAPKSCILENNFSILSKNFFGLSDIESYTKWAKKTNKTIYSVHSDMDFNKKVILQRLRRAIKIIGLYNFNVFTNNCVYAANYISFGKHSFLYPEKVYTLKYNRSSD